MHGDVALEAFARVFGLITIDIKGGIEIGFIGANPTSDRGRIDDRFEGRSRLAFSLGDAVELVGFKVGTADHRSNPARTRIDTHHRGLSEGTPIISDGGVDDFFGFGLPLGIEGGFDGQATLLNCCG